MSPAGSHLRLALSVAGAFDAFVSRLEITGLQQSTVSSRQQAVRAALERRLNVLDSFLTGSYRRHTMISPLSGADIDLFCVLDPNYHGADGQRTLLDRVRAVLRETYPTTPEIRPDGQAVTIRFRDFKVDVVPGFHRTGGGFLIPSTSERRWIETNPKVHEEFIARANAQHNGKLVPVIKMVKAWNRNHGSRLHSFYVELMAESVLRGAQIGSYSGAVGFVLAHAREKVRWKVIDPAALDGGEVNGIARGSVDEAVATAVAGYGIALLATRAERAGERQRAKEFWRQLFGDPFPGG